MILLTVTTDWISASASALALCFTAFAIYDTRKNAEDIQRQVDSLAKLASTYQKTRRDEINPNFLINDFMLYGQEKACKILLINNGGFAKNFKILKFEILNHYIAFDVSSPTTIAEGQTVQIVFHLEDTVFSSIYNKRTTEIVNIKFTNKDGETFTQQLIRDGYKIITSHPPEGI